MAAPEDPRAFDGPTAVQSGAATTSPVVDTPSKKKRRVPPPKVVAKGKVVTVAVGLSPEAPGKKNEKATLDRLERSVVDSPDPPTFVRRLRPGNGDARFVCRERRDDLVILVGYLPDRDDPVLLPHDCALDRALGVRAGDAAGNTQLVRTLWAEREDLVRQGFRERRRVGRLGPKARAGIIAGVALVVIGVAVGVLVAGALRDDTVVLKVGP